MLREYPRLLHATGHQCCDSACMSSAHMQTSAAFDPKAIRYVIPDGQAEPPLYRSRYGGLWVDRRDAHDIRDPRRARGEVTDVDAEVLAHYIDHGYVVLPKATDEALIDDYIALFEAAWDTRVGAAAVNEAHRAHNVGGQPQVRRVRIRTGIWQSATCVCRLLEREEGFWDPTRAVDGHTLPRAPISGFNTPYRQHLGRPLGRFGFALTSALRVGRPSATLLPAHRYAISGDLMA